MENTIYQRITSPKLEKQNGFAVVFLVCLMPLILAAIIFLYIGTNQIEIRSALNQTCRAELMNAQKTASSYIRALMAINKLVDVVKWARFIAVIAQLVAGPLAFVATIAIATLRIVNTAEKAIPLIQKGILTALATGMEISLLKGHNKIKNVLTSYARKSEQLVTLSTKIVFGNFIKELSVEPEQPTAQVTKYRLKSNFEDKQKLFLHWRYELKTNSHLLQWAKWQQTFHGHCAATLKKEEPWEPTLYADKFYWKFF